MADVDVSISEDAVMWAFGDNQIVIPQGAPPRSACFVPERRLVVVVEALTQDALNAVVYDLAGRERLRLQPPTGTVQGGFDQVFVDKHGVIAIFDLQSILVWGRPDLLTGEIPQWQEWR